ncbi:MAG: hypothetical protein QOE71_2144 [Pseudonocardiales bacterium]|nr:hypothetical protein [Pseudonocardiales bacterium]
MSVTCFKRSAMLSTMSRGPTRRVRRLMDSGQVSDELLQAADREADLLDPYIGAEHLELARLDLGGRTGDREALRLNMTMGVSRRWWRPRGPLSALRRRGVTETRAARQAADGRDRRDDPKQM